jgi:predicted lipid-binding transport protein (Tim44 family)
VIDSSNKLAPLLPGLALQRRPEPPQPPASERDDATPQGQVRHSASEVEAARAMLAARERPQTGAGEQPVAGVSLRSRRALEAYATHQYRDQRDYVARVLGVDEYA